MDNKMTSEVNERLKNLEKSFFEMSQSIAGVVADNKQSARLQEITETLNKQVAKLETRVDGIVVDLKPLVTLPASIAELKVISKASVWLAGAVVLTMLGAIATLVVRL